MINYLASACLSGVLMYSFGFKEAINYTNNKNQGEPNIIKKFLAGDLFQKSNPSQGQHQIKQLKLSSVEQIERKYKSDTFSPNTVQPSTRLINLNPACYIHYSTLLRAPLAVHQLLTKNMLEGTAQRQRKFFKDPTLSSNQKDKRFAVDDKYYTDTKAFRTFNFNRGHMAAAGNYDFDQSYKTSTFSLANTIPQNGQNNSGIWNTFERYCRRLLTEDTCDTLQIISGPVYHSNTPHPEGYKDVYQQKLLVMKQNGIMVPPMLYKIIKCNKSSGSYVSGFMLPNKQTTDENKDNDRKLTEFQTTLQEIQVRTGLNFNFGDNIQSLHEIDSLNLNKTKRQYDQPFYRYIIQKATKIGDINQALMRAYNQGIYIKPQDYHDKIIKMASQQFQDVNSNPQTTVCHKLNNQLNLHKSLYYLKVKGELIENIDESIYNKIIPCRLSNQSQISNILKKVSRQNKKYSYPHNIFIKKVFSTYRQQKQQSN